MIALPDVNVLLALAWTNHVHHDAAHRWFSSASANGWATCVLTQSAFLRLSMNPHVVHATIDCATARQLLSGLVAHSKHQFIADSQAVTASSFDPLVPRIRGYQQLTDATLLWFAKCHGLELTTFDQGIATWSPWPGVVKLLAA